MPSVGLRSRWLDVVCVLLVLSGAGCSNDAEGGDPDAPVACTNELLVGPDGQRYGRDPTKGCKFVDDDGDVVPSQ